MEAKVLSFRQITKQMEALIKTLDDLHRPEHPIHRAQHREKAIEQIEDLRSELHLLQMELEQGESVADAMKGLLP